MRGVAAGKIAKAGRRGDCQNCQEGMRKSASRLAGCQVGWGRLVRCRRDRRKAESTDVWKKG